MVTVRRSCVECGEPFTTELSDVEICPNCEVVPNVSKAKITNIVKCGENDRHVACTCNSKALTDLRGEALDERE